ncbi:hypothetical protein UFOVP227_31 [uncultured Caudovirales phage]|uniref:Uncharacterized protein n=1 Tax=uncultured Caudovirales phage TaxID=2100421 RepID=A0A6J7WM04_9CAUD|nr:hypothetical protein UFOVP227_31 [uncultured Caudovirales phage]
MATTYTVTCVECGADFVLALTYERRTNGVGEVYVSELKTCKHMFNKFGMTVSWKSPNDPITTVTAGPL